MTETPQGIIGDPGLPGRDGDPGIEVMYSSHSDNFMLSFVSGALLSIFGKCNLFLTGVSRTTRPRWKTRT